VKSMHSGISDTTRAKYEANLATVQEQFEAIENKEMSSDEIEYAALMAEKKGIVSENIKHLTQLLAKHEPYSKRAILHVLNENKVNLQVYFNGVMNGDHCFKFCEKGEKIMDGITKLMLEKFNDNGRLRDSLLQFDKQMKAILQPWYSNMRFMASADFHSDDDITKFKTELKQTKAAIVDLVVESPPLVLDNDEPVLKLMTTLKSHMAFGKAQPSITRPRDDFHTHVTVATDHFHLTGAIDEQNGERTHADFNQLMGRFCGVRGVQGKVLMMEEFHFSRSEPIREKIRACLETTSRKTRTVTRSGSQYDNELSRITSEVEELPRDEDDVILPAELTEDEIRMNDANELRGPTSEHDESYASLSDRNKKLLLGMDTNIIVCKKCLERTRFVGKKAYEIHCSEMHHTSRSADIDANDEVREGKVR